MSASYSPVNEKLEQSYDRLHSFPGGNEAILRAIVKSLIPDAIAGGGEFAAIHNGHIQFEALDRPDALVRIRSSATVVNIANGVHSSNKGELATITYAREGRLFSVRARAVVVASASWTAKHLITELPADYLEAMSHFPRSPMLVVNVALTNWRFLYKLGFTACSWRGGFPVARARMLGTTYREYERQIRLQMVKMFSGSGFDSGRDIAGIVLNRWGHAYVNAGPGFYFAQDGKPAPRDILRKPLARLAFAHSELEGNQNWGAAIREARRAAEQVITMG